MCRYANVPIGCAQLIIQFYEWPSYQLAHWHIGTFMHYFFACSSNCFPFSMASSIVPTFRKACSGRSSTSPSRIIRKPLIVSSMETITPGKLFGYGERLRKEPLYTTCTIHKRSVFIRKFFHTQNRNDILQLFVTLKNLFYPLCHFIMLLPHDMRIENT